MTAITEKWAHTAPLGKELNRICAIWMGAKPYEFDPCGGGCYRDEWPPYSTDWSAAGPLLEAMKGFTFEFDEMGETPSVGDGFHLAIGDVRAADHCLAIARACAVLAARGVTREDLG